MVSNIMPPGRHIFCLKTSTGSKSRRRYPHRRELVLIMKICGVTSPEVSADVLKHTDWINGIPIENRI